MKHRIFWIYLALLFPGPLLAQRYNFINYNISDGLAHEKVTDLVEDTFGNLWIATLGGGLSRFNGIEFENYTERDGLSNNIVRQVSVDSKGNVWAATSNGISVFDGFRFRNFLKDTVQYTSSVNVIEGDNNGNIWFSHPSGGLGKINSNFDLQKVELSDWTPNDKIIDIKCDSLGRVFFVTAIQGLFVYENLNSRPILTNKQFLGYLLEIEVQDNGSLVAGSNKGLAFIDLSDPISFELTREGSFVTSSVGINDSERWLVSGGRAFKEVNGKLFLINRSNGFIDSSVSRIYRDREDNIWFATDGDGIVKLGNDSFELYTQNNGLYGQPITSITQDANGDYYIASFGAGVQIFSKESQFLPLVNPQLTNVTSSVVDQNGEVWFGTRNQGVIKYDGEDFVQFTSKDGLINSLVRVLYNDSDNRLWVGTAGGISIYEKGEFSNFNVDSGLPDNVIWGIFQNSLNEVTVTTRKGICKFIDGKLIPVELDPVLFENRINVSVQDKFGNYWLGYSGHGIVKTTPGSTEHIYYTADDGLTSDLIYNLLFDINGDLIVGSERGVDKLVFNELFELERIKSYDKVEGIEGVRTLYNSIYQDGKGNIWLGNSQGLIRYSPKFEKLNSRPPITYISGIALDYQDITWEQDQLKPIQRVPGNIEFNYNENNLIISYLGNSLRNPMAVTYQYRLLGLEDWSPVTKKREAVYTNIPPGDYTFQVRAANSDGFWSLNPAEIGISIVPPFWQEPWFYLLVGLILLLIIKLYNDFRIKKNLDKVLTVERIRAEELVKVRKRMARDFHDNMGNQLASITVFTNLIGLRLKHRSKEIDDLLENIEKHTKSLFNGTKDFIWSIDPESDDLNEVFTYIKDFGEELFENTPMDFYSSTKEFKNLPLPSGWSRQIVLICKEAMTNALKHSKGTEVHLDLNLISNGFVIKVWDNGIGVQIENVKKGNGFRNMRTRAVQMGGELDIQLGENNIGLCIEFKATIRSELKENKVKIF
ncbi:MAG: two-component regulator propeller domain-containing protein [Bacteroidota bacterium]